MYVVIILLLCLLTYHFYNKQREFYEDYDENTCATLAAKNQLNLNDLKDQVADIKALSETVANIQISVDANTSKLDTLVSNA